MEKLYLNPYVTILESDNKIVVKGVKEYSFKIDKKEGFCYLVGKTELTKEELLRWFSDVEIKLLLESRLLLLNKELVPSTSGMLSRQRGLFSIISPDYHMFEYVLKSMKILIIGAGALGTHILWGLISMGVTEITILDFDIVEESNLNRQLFYGYQDIGKKKIEVLRNRVACDYPNVNLKTIDIKIGKKDDLRQVISHDFVFKAFDTPNEGIEWVNDICVEKRIPYISGGFINEIGVVGPIYVPGITTCYKCIPQPTGTKYNKLGPTFSPIVTNVTSRIIMVFLNIILKKYENIAQYSIFNYISGEWNDVNVETRKKCDVCGKDASYDHININNVLKYFMVTLLGVVVSYCSIRFKVTPLNHALIAILMITSLKYRDNAKFILNCSTIIASIASVSFFITMDTYRFSSISSALELIVVIMALVVTVCISISVVAFCWYMLDTFIRRFGELFKNAKYTKFIKKI